MGNISSTTPKISVGYRNLERGNQNFLVAQETIFKSTPCKEVDYHKTPTSEMSLQ